MGAGFKIIFGVLVMPYFIFMDRSSCKKFHAKCVDGKYNKEFVLEKS